MRRNTHYINIVILLAAILAAGCAKITTPTGGPTDTTPPKVVKVDLII